MPEKTLWTRHVGMAALNSVGSTGSCDSMESISSNHSAFSGDGYDHLSAEERECLMFLEETIDSLDNEDDSGVSNDELETPEKSTSHSTAEPAKVTTSSGNEKPRPLSTVFLQAEEWTPVAKIPQGYHSFPRIIQVSREENPVHTAESKVPESDSDQAKSWYGKPKSMSSINRPQTVEPPIDFLIIPPPEPFRDPQVLIDKRRSVTDPTDARELRYEKPQFRPPTISENKELPPVVKPFSIPTPLLFPRVTSPKTTTSSQETISQVEDKSVDAKQGPPTAPKPRTLPPHIIIKSSSGVVSNLDPQSRPRTFSAHERYMDRAPEPSIPKVTHSKEHERARLEALQKLGFIVKSSSQENISLRASKTDLSIAHVGDQGDQDLNRKSDVNQQHRVDLMGTTSTQPSTILKADDRQVRSESPSKSVKIIKSSSVEKVEPVSGTTLIQKTPNAVEISPQHIKSSIFDRSRPSVKAKAQEKADVVIQTSKPLNEVPTATDGSRNTVDSTKHKSPSHSHASSKVDNKSGPSGYSANILTTESDLSLKQGLDRKPSTLKATPVEKQTVFPEIHPAPFNSSGPLSIGEKPQEKVGSFENISHISTSPGKPFSFPRPKEIVVTPHSPEVQGKEQVPDKSNRHSTHFEPSNEPYLRFPQGSVPGLRQINIKANTLERSGVGLSGSMSSIEKESQKANGSFFKKPLFSGNFLRSNRPRPASLGTGKDFAYLESSTVDGETTEKRSFFSRPRSSGPVTSVKITPKGTSEEHRKEALKKLGILKE